MAQGPAVRLRVAAPAAEARRLCARLTRGGIPAASDDGSSRAEILVVSEPSDLGPYRSRADWLRRQGVLGEDGQEDVVIIRGRLPEAASSSAQRPNVRSSRRPRAGASAIAARVSESPARSSVSPTSTGSIES